MGIRWLQLWSGDRHGTDAKGQSSDGTGTSGNFAKYNSGGGLTDGAVPPATKSAVSHFFLTAYNAVTGAFSTAQPAFTDLTGSIATSQMASGVNTQTGTSYTFVDGDRDKLVTFSNASSIAGTLPQAGGSSQFVSGWFAWIENRGAGTLTVTPTTSTIDGASSLTLATNQGIGLFSDGTNYFTQRGDGSASPLTTKGDIYTHSTVDARLPVGTNGQVLTANSSSTTGNDWEPPVALTTTGTSGPATLTPGNPYSLNIPQYSGGGGAAVPGTISDLLVWYRSDSMLVTAGNLVGLIYDNTPWAPLRSAISVTANQGVSSFAALLNGLPVWGFPGNSNGRYSIQNPPIFSAAATIFVVFNPGTITGAQAISFIAGSANSLEFCAVGGNVRLVQTNTAVIGTSSGVTLSAGTWYQSNATYNPSTGAFAFRIGRASAGSGTNAKAISVNSSSFGYNQAGGGAGEDMIGQMTELIAYNRVLTLSEITSVETYLNSKWGV